MKIFFIGIHNKNGLKPLDSSTISGKTIDAVIEKLNEFECEKVNLFDADEMPPKEIRYQLAKQFIQRVGINNDDVLVVLGSDVRKYLIKHVPYLQCIEAAHPSLRYSKIKRQDYIDDLYGKILFSFACL